jgi:hypothetical protein
MGCINPLGETALYRQNSSNQHVPQYSCPLHLVPCNFSGSGGCQPAFQVKAYYCITVRIQRCWYTFGLVHVLFVRAVFMA